MAKAKTASQVESSNGTSEKKGTNGSAKFHDNEDRQKSLKDAQIPVQEVPNTTPAMKAVPDSLHPKIAAKRSSKVLNAFGYLLRTLILDLPLLLLFALYVSTVVLRDVTVQYYIPQVNLMKWNKQRQIKELTYYHRLCTDEDITTNRTDDLVIHPDMNSEDCMVHMLKHGVSIYTNLISDTTAAAARAFILERNKLEKNWGVISNKNRWSFGVDVNSHPSIQQALKEIGQNQQLTSALRKIVGRNAAVIEFTGITAAYGAADQYLHKDVVPRGSAFKYGRNFVPSYSLFIPLQDITAEMGCTEVCPGTHLCTSGDYNPCDKNAMFVSGKKGWWKSGNGALVNQQLYHRGTAHSDLHGPERVLFILTFAGRPRFGKNQLESRLIGFEGSYSLKWDQWGHTLLDFSQPDKHMTEPWRKLRALGLYKPPGRDWGWDYVTVASMRIANEDTSYTPDDLEKFVEQGGYSFIPAFLKVKPGEDDGWTDYLLKSIENVMNWLQTLNIQVIVGYLIAMTFVNLVLWLAGVNGKGSVLVGAIGRLMVTHGLVLLIAYLVTHRINISQWGENIRLQKAFRGYREPVSSSRPGTLPNEMDVLVDDRYQSSYLASYARVLEVQHPGNQNYYRLIDMNAINYHNLPPPAQQDLAKMVMREMKTINFSRLLTQTGSKWAVMSEEEAIAQIHVDLAKASHPTLEFILTHLHFFRNELAAGVYRETVLHKKHIPDLFDNLQSKLIGHLPIVAVHAPGSCRPGPTTSLPLQFVRSPLSAPLTLRMSNATHFMNYSIPTPMPPPLEVIPPWPSAWIEEGDIVDARYKGAGNGTYCIAQQLSLR